MNEGHNKPHWSHTSSQLRGTILAIVSLLFLYVFSFILNTYSGGYFDQLERDGHDRYSFGLSMPTAVLWQPRFGFWAPYRSDSLGTLYSPLIRLDRKYLHPTHYISDPSFDSWERAATVSDWHPRFRAAFLELRSKQP